MSISAAQVKELREKTGAGMMDCKKALSEADGNIDKAVKYLREKGISKAAKRAGRETKEGSIGSYSHPGDKLVVMVEVTCETDFVARTDEFKGMVKDLAMHVAAANPIVVRREELDSEQIDKEREIYRTQAINEKKPEKIIDKIVDGKIQKYYSEVCLLEQPFVKDPDKSVGDIVQDAIAKLGENIIVRRFVRFALGE